MPGNGVGEGPPTAASPSPAAGALADATAESFNLGPTTLRISVTDRCDLRCRYCMPAGGAPFVPQRELPGLDELAGAVRWLAGHAADTRVKITGGEPLVRRSLPSFVRALAAIPAVREVSMTTNGTSLARHAAALAAAGLARVNVSLDTLDPERFATLTRGGDVRRVVAGIDAARAAGLDPVKLNAVLRASAWRDDVPRLLDFAAARGLEVRFIELMRTGTEAAWAAREFVAADVVRSLLEREGRLLALPAPASAPARRTLARWHGQDVAVGWITPISHAFCAACDRLRLDARGQLRRCLMDPLPLPLVALLRAGRDGETRAALRAYLAAKRTPLTMDTEQAMRAIGG